MRIVQAVPALAHPPGGVGSYASMLAQALFEGFGITTRFVAANPPQPVDGFGTVAPIHLGALRAGDLHRLLSAEADGDVPVLLHYVNYGYARRGCPVWLLRGLARWKGEAPGRRLLTLFHEVHASGPPWRSSFWLSPLQRHLARRLARLSDGIATSLGLYADLLGRWVGREQVTLMPVFSTVGEPEEVPNLADRQPSLVVFGGVGARSRAYGELRAKLAKSVETLGIEVIEDVGAPLPKLPSEVAGRPVRGHGFVPRAEVREVLQRALAGFVAYPAGFLAKSTIFAAYAAHGVLPVCAWPRPSSDGELRRGHHYWAPDDKGRGDGRPDWAAIAAAAHGWYAGHCLDRQAPIFRRLLFG